MAYVYNGRPLSNEQNYFIHNSVAVHYNCSFDQIYDRLETALLECP